MNDLVVADKGTEWGRLKALVLDSVSSPITRRVYNLGLDEFIAWYGQEARPGFTKAAVNAWRITLEARGLGSISINVRITAVRKLAVEAADNGFAGAGTGRRHHKGEGRRVQRRPGWELVVDPAGPEANEHTRREHQEGTARPSDACHPPGLRASPI